MGPRKAKSDAVSFCFDSFAQQLDHLGTDRLKECDSGERKKGKIGSHAHDRKRPVNSDQDYSSVHSSHISGERTRAKAKASCDSHHSACSIIYHSTCALPLLAKDLSAIE